MRITRLDLMRYGRFTDLSLAFPKKENDVHVIYGPNEAGKSTALNAIEDLLFGIPKTSPYNFLHDYNSMRVGGVLEHEETVIELRRRKGNKDTLLGTDDLPLAAGEGALAPFLGSADRAFLERMFSLNHERLARGGREILEAKDEVGQALFSAGAGVAGLREEMEALKKEAESLWAPRRAAHRKFYQAQDELDEAERNLREHTVTAARWHETRRALDAAQEACRELEEEIEILSAEQRRLARIRRVYRDVRRLDGLECELAALGDVPSLPDDAREHFERARQEETKAASLISELAGQLREAQAERAGLNCDDGVLQREEDIGELHRQRIEVHKEKADLPRRRAELEAMEAELHRLAGELGWDEVGTEEVRVRLPRRAQIAAARELLTGRGGRDAAVTSARDALEETRAKIRELRQELEREPDAPDISTLAAVLRASGSLSDINARIKTAEGEAADAEAALGRELKRLRLQVENERALAETPVPPRSAVQDHRDAARALAEDSKSVKERIAAVEREIERQQKARERFVRDEKVVSEEELIRVRAERDDGWSLIRRHYIEGQKTSKEELEALGAQAGDAAEAYEGRVSAADRVADERFATAQAAGQLAAIESSIQEMQEALDDLHKDEKALHEKSRALEARWRDLWAEAPFEPLEPDFMLDWLDGRAKALELIERRGRTAREAADLRRQEEEARAAILRELTALGEETDALKGLPLRALKEAAAAVQQRHEKQAEHRAALERQMCKLGAEEKQRQGALEKAEAAWREWRERWKAALKELGLDGKASPEAANVQLETLERMREIARDSERLRRDRIEKIERDISSFAVSVAALVQAVAADLVGEEPDEAVIALEVRLQEAQLIRARQAETDRAIATLENRIGECESARREAQQAIRELKDLAGVEDDGQLEEAIARADRKRELEAERGRLEATLADEGDGLPLAELRQECEDVDLDRVAAKEETLQAGLSGLRERLVEAAGQRADSRRAFEAIGGDDRAARAAAARQEALADMRDVAERYVRVRTASMLLHWAIDRYRREKQAPLLKRAGEIFATLTSRSFCGLRVEYDEQDRARLAGVRPDESTVGVDGMSDGTADQLYLALRMASVAEYLERAHPLPFVADDLFINFDDSRAAAGFEALAELGRQTQVLFFTHHRHLVEIAQEVVGGSIDVVALGAATNEST